MEQISLNGTICQSVSDARAKSKLEPSQTHPEQEARRLSCSELQSHRSECGDEDEQRHTLEVELSERNRKSLLEFRSLSCEVVHELLSLLSQWVSSPQILRRCRYSVNSHSLIPENRDYQSTFICKVLNHNQRLCKVKRN